MIRFPVEINSCAPYLDEQLEMIRPKVIVTLGRFSFSKFFPGEAISRARGKPRDWNGLVVYPMYHPAAALRNPNLRHCPDGGLLPRCRTWSGEVSERKTVDRRRAERSLPISQLNMFGQ